jgi:hypothetical protein
MLGDLDHLAAIGPLSIRVAVARERLRADATSAAARLEAVLGRGGHGDDRARRALLACCIALAQDDGEPWALALANQARAQRLRLLGSVLRDAEPRHAVRLPGRLSEPCVSIMWATSFASLSLRDRFRVRWLPRDRVLLHSYPEVVRRLLRGPALRLDEALVIASRRPTSDAIVREITGSLRWMGRIEVREALVANPFVRPRVALALLPTVLSPARRALGRGAVHPLLARAVAELHA